MLITYSKANLTAEEIQSGIGETHHPLREFGIICRHELESLRRSL